MTFREARMAEHEGQQTPRTQVRRRGTPTPKTVHTGERSAAPDRGSIALRRTVSEYRATAEEQAARVREEIEAALVQARGTREAIEQRIADQLHAPPVSPAPAPAPRRKQRRSRASRKK
ncbi:hypothetical protein HV824_21660 [Myxococcus sp. AM009]|uniref:hypothetical protein n=1 Tax=Myxococcus sp. AM009 TaxID=2745137 RepID=UPI0015958D78|nr:hypothetical protein [Myxococcus sp. AM009]NVJ00706.1 hypothetical protein [Myxococcus sp. AM009]